MKIAAIDLGSQTFRMALAECSGHCIRTAGSWLENVRLGEGLGHTGIINAQAMKRGIDTIEKFMAIIEDQGATSITATGTAALRHAVNAEVFLRIAAEKGLAVRVISGENEAEIAAAGVFYTLMHNRNRAPGHASDITPHSHDEIVILDVGGGSTEISLCRRGKIKYWISIDIGAVSMTEKFFRSDTDIRQGTRRLSCLVDAKLSDKFPVHAGYHSSACIAGVGGTITTLAAMESALESYQPEKIRGFVLSRQCMDIWITRLSKMTNSEKHCISGLEPERSDIILAGMVIVRRIMEKLGFSSLVTSDGGLLLGLLIRAIEKECISHAESSGSGGLYV